MSPPRRRSVCVFQQMGSRRASEHDNIMSLLMTALSRADGKAIIDTSNNGTASDRRRKLSLGWSLRGDVNRTREDSGRETVTVVKIMLNGGGAMIMRHNYPN